MTVNPVNDPQDRVSNSDLQQNQEFSSPEITKDSGYFTRCLAGKKILKVFTETETDQESGESSEEMESPKSVAKVGQWRRKKIASVHSQVMRIREEDLHLGEDLGEGLSAKDKVVKGFLGHHCHRNQQVDMVLFSRPILPCSPLSGNTTVRPLHRESFERS